MLEGAEARHGVEGSEALPADLACVAEVHLEVMAAAGGRLRGGQGDAHAVAPSAPDERQQRAPPAAEVEHTPARSDPDLVGHVFVLAPLSLLKAE